MSTLLTTSSQRDDNAYPHLVPLLAGLFGGLGFICICGLAWCVVRRRKHRAPVIPYSLTTLRGRHGNAQPGDVVTDGGEDGSAAAALRIPRPAKLGTHGRGVGYGFNPVLKEPFGGGGGLESGKGPVGVQRAGALYG